MAICDTRSAAQYLGARTSFGLDPIRTFIATSLLFGSLTIAAAPPLRGPDETAHFLRAYGVAAGDIVPSIRDAQGRMGIFLPPRLYAGFNYFEDVRIKEKGLEWKGYAPVFQAYFSRQPTNPGADPIFVLYAGSEGYSPVAYLPQVAAGIIARALDLDFLATSYLMRFAGLIVLTAAIAYAISIVPQLAWALVAIAMLPAALYGRSVINPGGAALAAAMVVSALWLRGSMLSHTQITGRQSFWMMLNALTKPPNLAFILLELLGTPPTTRRWYRILATLPAIVVALLWIACSGADTAVWRMVEITGQEAVAFDPTFKIHYLLHHPLHFPAAVIASLEEKNLGELWRQLIGVLGLFDTTLQSWAYPTLTALLLGTFLTTLRTDSGARRRIAIAAGMTALTYAVGLYLICYLVFTPHDADSVWGVQGRYFVPVLPLLAIVLTAIANRGAGERFRALLAISGAVLSGSASLHAILEIDWNFGPQ